MILVAEFMDVASANTALKLVGAAIHTFLQLLRLALFQPRTSFPSLAVQKAGQGLELYSTIARTSHVLKFLISHLCSNYSHLAERIF